MADRWSIPLQAITAGNYQRCDHIQSTCEMKTRRWWETVVGLIQRPPSLTFNISQSVLWVRSRAASVFVVFFKSSTESVYCRGAENILDQFTNNKQSPGCLWIKLHPDISFHSIPFRSARCEIPSQRLTTSKHKTWYRTQKKCAESSAKFFVSEMYLNIPHRSDPHSGLSSELYYTSHVIDCFKVILSGGRPC